MLGGILCMILHIDDSCKSGYACACCSSFAKMASSDCHVAEYSCPASQVSLNASMFIARLWRCWFCVDTV